MTQHVTATQGVIRKRALFQKIPLKSYQTSPSSTGSNRNLDGPQLFWGQVFLGRLLSLLWNYQQMELTRLGLLINLPGQRPQAAAAHRYFLRCMSFYFSFFFNSKTMKILCAGTKTDTAK